MRLHLPPDAEMGRFPGLVSNSCALIIVFDSAIVNTYHTDFSILSAQDEEREDFSVLNFMPCVAEHSARKCNKGTHLGNTTAR